MKNNYPSDKTFVENLDELRDDLEDIIALDKQKTRVIRLLLIALIVVTFAAGFMAHALLA